MSQTHLPPFDKAAYTPQDHPYAIHVGEVIEEKVHRRLPTPILRTLERVIHQREINDILYRYSHLEGMDFLEALVGEFRLDLDWVHPERLPEHGRCIFASNHPLGGMDGIAISYMLGHRYGDVRYMVNDMLYHLKPLQPVFLPLNKHGAQGKEAVALLQEAMQSEVPIGTFPAGFCSRVYDGKIQDQIWRKTSYPTNSSGQRGRASASSWANRSPGRACVTAPSVPRKKPPAYEVSATPSEMSTSAGRSNTCTPPPSSPLSPRS